MPRTILISQDDLLVDLAMWPKEFAGRTIKEVPVDQRGPIYKQRAKLSRMLKAVHLPGEEDVKYRARDAEALVERNLAA